MQVKGKMCTKKRKKMGRAIKQKGFDLLSKDYASKWHEHAINIMHGGNEKGINIIILCSNINCYSFLGENVSFYFWGEKSAFLYGVRFYYHHLHPMHCHTWW